ncbi:MAG TPA: response regulator [Pelobium sp.]|nr:response regulator [Pelobium sp.]
MVKTTFIIDDDEIYVYAIKRLINIRKLSENIVSFKNGKEAIDYFTDTSIEEMVMPDVILLDVRMPIMDGWGFLEAFSELDFIGKHKVGVFMVSSSIDPRDLDKANQFPMVEKYLFKPIDSDDLMLIFSNG